jgi:non-reducing end alpha-L-arabinofuranosidase
MEISLQGAIILGAGGDGSNGGTGTFYEGIITKGNPSDDIDDAIQANIVAAGTSRVQEMGRPTGLRRVLRD